MKFWSVPVVAFSLLLPAVQAWATDSNVCPDTPVVSSILPTTKAAIAAGRPVTIVALGSSSTRGAGASDPAHSYPAVLQAMLGRLLPAIEVSVINRGNDGEDALRELARLDTDVLAVRPSLVIWQVGANGALRGTDPATFSEMVGAGVALLRQAGSDVILLDNQRAPKILDAPGHVAIEHALADVAVAGGVNFFSRSGLMDAWRGEGYAYDLFIGPDGLHHNDRGYRCIGEAVAKAIVAGLSAPTPSVAGRPIAALSPPNVRLSRAPQ